GRMTRPEVISSNRMRPLERRSTSIPSLVTKPSDGPCARSGWTGLIAARAGRSQNLPRFISSHLCCELLEPTLVTNSHPIRRATGEILSFQIENSLHPISFGADRVFVSRYRMVGQHDLTTIPAYSKVSISRARLFWG